MGVKFVAAGAWFEGPPATAACAEANLCVGGLLHLSLAPAFRRRRERIEQKCPAPEPEHSQEDRLAIKGEMFVPQATFGYPLSPLTPDGNNKCKPYLLKSGLCILVS